MSEPRSRVTFAKMHGAGNDFVVVDNRVHGLAIEDLASLSKKWCNRKRGIGADGVLVLQPPKETHHDFRMVYFNADGSRATMCGNGARCLARYARTQGFDNDPLTIETDAGTYTARVPEDPAADVRLFVPPPRDARLHDLEVDGEQLHYVWTGTHHVVLFVDDVAKPDVARRGERLRHHERYQPEGTNVNFVQVADSDRLNLRTYEKGVEAETEACGTGAIASAVIANMLGLVQGDVAEVHTSGGTLKIGVGDRYFLEGPAVVSFWGKISLNIQAAL